MFASQSTQAHTVQHQRVSPMTSLAHVSVAASSCTKLTGFSHFIDLFERQRAMCDVFWRE